jgi:hypothetical protein
MTNVSTDTTTPPLHRAVPTIANTQRAIPANHYSLMGNQVLDSKLLQQMTAVVRDTGGEISTTQSGMSKALTTALCSPDDVPAAHRCSCGGTRPAE